MFYPKVVVHTCKSGKGIAFCKAIIHRKHCTQVVEATFLGIVGKPKQFRGNCILEAAVQRLVCHLQTVTPIQLGINTVFACAFVKEGADGFAAYLELETAIT